MIFILFLFNIILTEYQMDIKLLSSYRPYESYYLFTRLINLCGEILTVTEKSKEKYVYLLNINKISSAGVYSYEKDPENKHIIKEEYILHKNGDLIKRNPESDFPDEFIVAEFSIVEDESIVCCVYENEVKRKKYFFLN